MNPRAAGAAAMRRTPQRFSRLYNRNVPRVYAEVPPGGKYGGQVKGYQMGGRAGIGRGGPPLPPMPQGWQGASVPVGPNIPIPPRRRGPGGWQEGGPVGVAPEEVAMASEIYARATPEQQDQITGGGGGAPAMDEEAAIGEALAMAMGGGGGGGPPMGGGGPPMGGMI